MKNLVFSFKASVSIIQCVFCFFNQQIEKGNDALRKAKSKSDQIEKRRDKVFTFHIFYLCVIFFFFFYL